MKKPYVPPNDAEQRLAKCNPAELRGAHHAWSVKQHDPDFLAEFPTPNHFACAVLLEDVK